MQEHFATPSVSALRAQLVRRMVRAVYQRGSNALRRALPAFLMSCLALGGAAAVGLLGMSASVAQTVAPGAGIERSVKAAFLYKFLGYTEFPPAAFADATSPLTIAL